MVEYIQVLTAVDDEKKVDEIACALLEARVAACVQIMGPIRSSYWWKGKIEQAKEWMCLAKAKAEDYKEIETIIKSVHPYEVPEILAVPISFGYDPYLNWICRETAPRQRHAHT